MAVLLAKHFSTNIISADSRQCFKELNIGVAKPSEIELQSVHHYFINSHSIQDTLNAAVYEQYALEKIATIFEERDIAIMVGGTGLYIKTFCEGIDEVPVILPGIREKMAADYLAGGLLWLQQVVQKHDSMYYSKGEILNPQRLMRALEVKLSTGKSIIEFQTQKKAVRDFDIIKIGLKLPRAELYSRINERVDLMITQGLAEEVKALENFKQLNALQTVGYRELFDHFAGKSTLMEAIEAIKINTRHYAKRQMTWFKKDESINWCIPDYKAVMEVVEKLIMDN